MVEEHGGKVLGSAAHPLNTADFASLLLRAQDSKAQVIALASAGADTVNAIKQAGQFAIGEGGQRVAALHAFVTDVNSLGLDVAQGLIITTGFYWDDNDATRAFRTRVFESAWPQADPRAGRRLYLRAALPESRQRRSHSDDAAIVNAAMRQLPVDRSAAKSRIQANGRVVYDLGVYRVKTPAQSRLSLGLLREDRDGACREAFRSVADSGCAAAVQSEAKAR